MPSFGAEKTARRSASPLEVTQGNQALRRIRDSASLDSVATSAAADSTVLRASSFGVAGCARAAGGDFDRRRGARPSEFGKDSGRAWFAARQARIGFGYRPGGALERDTTPSLLATAGPHAHSATLWSDF